MLDEEAAAGAGVAGEGEGLGGAAAGGRRAVSDRGFVEFCCPEGVEWVVERREDSPTADATLLAREEPSTGTASGLKGGRDWLMDRRVAVMSVMSMLPTD